MATLLSGAPPSARAADEVRMRDLYEVHGQPLYRFLLRLTFGEPQAAEDLLQETLIRAWRHLDNLPADVHSLGPWLFTVARRVAIDAGRAKQARPRETGADPTVMPADDDPIDRFVNAHYVRTALATLTPDHRRVLLEIYYRGRTVPETAAVLAIPEGTVKSRVYNALRALRQQVGPLPVPAATRPPGR